MIYSLEESCFAATFSCLWALWILCGGAVLFTPTSLCLTWKLLSCKQLNWTFLLKFFFSEGIQVKIAFFLIRGRLYTTWTLKGGSGTHKCLLCFQKFVHLICERHQKENWKLSLFLITSMIIQKKSKLKYFPCEPHAFEIFPHFIFIL